MGPYYDGEYSPFCTGDKTLNRFATPWFDGYPRECDLVGKEEVR